MANAISQKAPLQPFSAQAKPLVRESIYQHYSGKRYKILAVGRSSETLEENVVYEALYGDHDVWVRPLTMFLEDVTIEGKAQPRFQIIDPPSPQLTE